MVNKYNLLVCPDADLRGLVGKISIKSHDMVQIMKNQGLIDINCLKTAIFSFTYRRI